MFSLEVRLIAWAVAAAALLGGLAWLIHSHDEEVRAKVTDAVQAVGAAQAASSAIQEAQWRAATDEVSHVAQARLEAASAAAGAAAREHDALLVQLAELRRRAMSSNPAASSGGPYLQGGDPIEVLADVLGRSDARASIVDDLADRRRIRAEACERWADSLTAK